jgi:LDH2 family malate/lactate/ureidoglycolate dehydrogenase
MLRAIQSYILYDLKRIYVRVDADTARSLVIGLLRQRKASQDNARSQADLLIEAELRGHPSHGLQRLPRLLARVDRGLVDPRTTGVATWVADSSLDVDGMKGFGPAVALAALQQLETRISIAGIAMATIHNSNHLGMLAPYVEKIAEWGCVGIAISSSEALVHPHGGTHALLGTNPIAIAVPTAERPMVLDLATSIVSMGKIHHYAASGIQIPQGWARDAKGRPTINAVDAKSGAIAPFGGAKGYGLGLALELLVAALAGTDLAPDMRGTLDSEFVCNKGDVLIAIRARPEAGLSKRLSEYLDVVRHSPHAEPDQPIAIPGDRATARRTQALKNGFEVDAALWTELKSLSRQSVLEGHNS